MKPPPLAKIVGADSDAEALEQLATAVEVRPSIHLIRALCDVSGTLSGKADEVLQRMLPDWAASDIDTSVVITGIDQVPRPQDYQQTLRMLAKHCSNGGLDTCDFQATRAALADDNRVVDALLALAGISYRQLADQLQRRDVSVPGSSEGPWQAYDPGLREVFAVVDDVVRGRGQYATETAPPGFKPARPIEMLWGEISGWAGVQHALDHGVTLGALVAQRAVGSAYRQHRDSTSTQVSRAKDAAREAARLDAPSIVAHPTERVHEKRSLLRIGRGNGD